MYSLGVTALKGCNLSFLENDKKADLKKDHPTQEAAVKKKERAPTKRRDQKPAFQHKWLASSLKNHSSPVLGIDFSPNGKYIASWSEGKLDFTMFTICYTCSIAVS